MTLAIEDVIQPTTAAEVEAEVLSLLATAGLPTSSWQPGSVVRTIIAELSEIVARKSVAEIEIARGGLGDLTSSEWAKLWAQQIYDVLFIPAAPATGYLTLANGTVDEHTIAVGDLIVAHRTTGKKYRNQVEVVVAANATTAPFAIESSEVGTGSDAAPGEITVIVSPGDLIGVTATNPAAVLGANEETTEALVKRARLRLAHLSPRGPKGAYDYVARTPLDSFEAIDETGLLAPTSTPITRSRTTLDPVTGDVVVNIATAGGAPTLDDVARVNAGIWRWAEPMGVTSYARGANEVTVAVTYRVWVQTKLTEDQVKALASAALARYLEGVDVGGVVIAPDTGAIYRETLEYVIRLAVPGTKRVQVTVPAGESMAVAADQVPVLGTITPTVTFTN